MTFKTPNQDNTRKHRFLMLDGMRGVAAFIVMQRHLDYLWNFKVFRSYLAVDLFFILSGFVIAHAYEPSLKTGFLSRWTFLKIRFVRLYPAFLASLIVCIFVQITINGSNSGFANFKLTELINPFFLTAGLIPNGHYSTEYLFPINVPYWSLLFELLVNLIYAMSIRWLNDSKLAFIVIASAALLAFISFFNKGLNVGVIFTIPQLAFGFVRSMFGISCGVLLFRKRAVVPKGLALSSVVLAGLAFAIMLLLIPDFAQFNFIVDLFLVVLLLPLLVLLGSWKVPKQSQAVLSVLGSASYPIYLFHIPLAGLISLLLGQGVYNHLPWSGLAYAAIIFTFAAIFEARFDAPLRARLVQLLIPERKKQLG